MNFLIHKPFMKYFAYCRRSQDREDSQTLSIDAQKRKLAEHAKRCGLNVIRTFEESRSAYKRGRPVLADMLARLEKGEADAVLTYHLTRLARNAFDGGYIIQLIDECIIKEICTPESAYRNTPDDKFMMQIHFAMSKKSSDDNSHFVTRDIESKLLKGEYPSFAPLGYLNIQANGTIAGTQYNGEKQKLLETLGRPLKRVEVDPIEGPRIRQLFEEASKGVYSIKKLCKVGAEIGVCGRRGNKPAVSTIFKTLTNPFYYGVIRFRNQLYTENVQHEALIPKKLFYRVQTMIDRRGSGSQRSHVFAYTGALRCGECNCAITAEIQRNIIYYHCTHMKGPCSQRKYSREENLEEQLSKVLGGLVIPQSFLSFGFEKMRKAHGEETSVRDQARRSLERRYDECKRRLDSLLQLKLSPSNATGELLSDEEYLAQKRSTKDDLDALDDQIKAQKQDGVIWVDDCEHFIARTQDFCRRFENGTFDEKKELLYLVCSNITLKDGEVAFSYAEPFASIAKFPLAGKPSFERLGALAEKQDASLFERWRSQRDSPARRSPVGRRWEPAIRLRFTTPRQASSVTSLRPAGLRPASREAL